MGINLDSALEAEQRAPSPKGLQYAKETSPEDIAGSTKTELRSLLNMEVLKRQQLQAMPVFMDISDKPKLRHELQQQQLKKLLAPIGDSSRKFSSTPPLEDITGCPVVSAFTPNCGTVGGWSNNTHLLKELSWPEDPRMANGAAEYCPRDNEEQFLQQQQQQADLLRQAAVLLTGTNFSLPQRQTFQSRVKPQRSATLPVDQPQDEMNFKLRLNERRQVWGGSAQPDARKAACNKEVERWNEVGNLNYPQGYGGQGDTAGYTGGDGRSFLLQNWQQQQQQQQGGCELSQGEQNALQGRHVLSPGPGGRVPVGMPLVNIRNHQEQPSLFHSQIGNGSLPGGQRQFFNSAGGPSPGESPLQRSWIQQAYQRNPPRAKQLYFYCPTCFVVFHSSQLNLFAAHISQEGHYVKHLMRLRGPDGYFQCPKCTCKGSDILGLLRHWHEGGAAHHGQKVLKHIRTRDLPQGFSLGPQQQFAAAAAAAAVQQQLASTQRCRDFLTPIVNDALESPQPSPSQLASDSSFYAVSPISDLCSTSASQRSSGLSDVGEETLLPKSHLSAAAQHAVGGLVGRGLRGCSSGIGIDETFPIQAAGRQAFLNSQPKGNQEMEAQPAIGNAMKVAGTEETDNLSRVAVSVISPGIGGTTDGSGSEGKQKTMQLGQPVGVRNQPKGVSRYDAEILLLLQQRELQQQQQLMHHGSLNSSDTAELLFLGALLGGDWKEPTGISQLLEDNQNCDGTPDRDVNMHAVTSTCKEANNILEGTEVNKLFPNWGGWLKSPDSRLDMAEEIRFR